MLIPSFALFKFSINLKFAGSLDTGNIIWKDYRLHAKHNTTQKHNNTYTCPEWDEISTTVFYVLKMAELVTLVFVIISVIIHSFNQLCT